MNIPFGIIIYKKCVRPVFKQENYVVIGWLFCFVWKDGTIAKIEEIAYQRWRNGLIIKEKFFYDRKQGVSKKNNY